MPQGELVLGGGCHELVGEGCRELVGEGCRELMGDAASWMPQVGSLVLEERTLHIGSLRREYREMVFLSEAL